MTSPHRVRSTVPPDAAPPPTRHPEAPEPGTVLDSHYAHCFGCGERHPTGLHMHVTAGEGVSITGAEVVATPVSDHLALVVTVE